MKYNLEYDIELCRLANKLFDDIRNCWKDPFSPPVVIMPDSLMENWFKQYWISRQPILMNLKFEKLDSFLFRVLSKDSKAKTLTSDILKLRLIDLLTTKIVPDTLYYKTLDSEVAQYIGEDKPDTNRLYDFSSTMAALFLEYEISRPSWFRDGLFPKCWQKKLYDDVIGTQLIINGCRYTTVPELYYSLKKNNEYVFDSCSPVFLFGFSAMGQVYREIINDLSEYCSVSIYVQAGSEDKLAQYGMDHLRGWDKGASYLNNKRPDFSLFSAPNKTREVEALHSRICNLLDGEENNHLMLNDIKIIAPNIGDYLTEINLVFGEPMVADDNIPNDYKHIPYCILDYTSQNSNLVKAMVILKDIFHKGYYSASDFNKLMNNTVVQAANDIRAEYCEDWTKWIQDMHIYRNRDGVQDWDIGKNRLLLSFLTDNDVTIDSNKCIPYGTISDDESIFMFTCFIEKLDNWLGLWEPGKATTLDDVKNCIVSLLSINFSKDKTLSGEKKIFKELMSSIGVLKLVFGEEWIVNPSILLLYVLESISGISLSKRGNTKGIEFLSFKANRVLPAKYTYFIGFDSNSFPGMDNADVLDLTKNDNDKHKDLDDSVSKKNRNTYFCQVMATEKKATVSFVNINLGKDEKFFRSSIVNPNMQEEIIPLDESRNLEELFTFRSLRQIGYYISKPLDNPMPYKDESSISKVTISQLVSYLKEPLKFQVESFFSYGNENDLDDCEFEPVSLNNLEFSSLRTKMLFKPDYKEQIQNELVNLIHDLSFREIAKEKLILQVESIQGGLVDILSPIENYNVKQFKKDLNYIGIRKQFYEACKTIDSLENLDNKTRADLLIGLSNGKKNVSTAKAQIRNIESLINDYEQKEKIVAAYQRKIELLSNPDVLVLSKEQPVIIQNGPKNYSVADRYSFYNADYKKTKTLFCIDINDKKKEQEFYLKNYVSSLALISDCDDGDYTVRLFIVSPKTHSYSEDYKPFTITTSEARKKLIELIEAALSKNNKRCLPIKYIAKELTIDELIDCVSDRNGGPWQYSRATKLLNPQADLGYSSDSFDSEWTEEVKKQKQLLEYLEPYEE